jgi:hypothetical protein
MRQSGSAPLSHAPVLPAYDPDDIDEVPGNEAEEAEEQIVDQATAAATLAELEAEIVILKDLEERALRLKLSGQDAKWRELESILDEPLMLDATTGLRRKVIIFTEPKDTLEYLQQKIRARVGESAAVVVIHGGILRVPSILKERDRLIGRTDPVLDRYARIIEDTSKVSILQPPPARRCFRCWVYSQSSSGVSFGSGSMPGSPAQRRIARSWAAGGSSPPSRREYWS